MDLRYSHKAELLHSLLVDMVKVLPWQQGYLLICIATKKNICAKYEVKLISFGSVIAQFPGCHGNNLFQYQQGKPEIPTALYRFFRVRCVGSWTYSKLPKKWSSDNEAKISKKQNISPLFLCI